MLHSNNSVSRWFLDIVHRQKICPLTKIESSDQSSILDVPINGRRRSRRSLTVQSSLQNRPTSGRQLSKCAALCSGDEKVTNVQIINLSLLKSQCIHEDNYQIQKQGSEGSLEGALHTVLQQSSTQSSAELAHNSSTSCTAYERSDSRSG